MLRHIHRLFRGLIHKLRETVMVYVMKKYLKDIGIHMFDADAAFFALHHRTTQLRTKDRRPGSEHTPVHLETSEPANPDRQVRLKTVREKIA